MSADLNDDMLLRKCDVAQLFRVTERTVDVWRARKGLPFLRVGKGVRFRREAVQQFVLEREKRNEPA